MDNPNPKLKTLERLRIRDALADAVRSVGGDERLGVPVMADRAEWKVDDNGRVRGPDGSDPEEVARTLQGQAEYAAVFGGAASGAEESWKGKKYSEMTTDEKIAYNEANYG